MKRIFASVVSAITLLSIATPALASPNFRTRKAQPRVSIRENRARAAHAWRNRDSAFITQRREYYNHVIRPIVSRPSYLAVTGKEENREPRPVARPSKRTVKNWTLADHCTSRSVRCEP